MLLVKPFGLAILLAAFFLVPQSRASNIVLDFSNSSNPNGVWTYLYNTSPTTETAFTASQATTFETLPEWYNGQGEPDAIYMVNNNSGSTVSYLTINDPTGVLWLDPEEYGVAVEFTAPTTGTYNIVGNFLGIDTGENSHPVEILENGSTVVYSNMISRYGEDDAFNLSGAFALPLSAGDTITFFVGTGSTGCTYCNLSTGLDGMITLATPEPASLFVCAAALTLMVFCGRRRLQARQRTGASR